MSSEIEKHSFHSLPIVCYNTKEILRERFHNPCAIHANLGYPHPLNVPE